VKTEDNSKERVRVTFETSQEWSFDVVQPDCRIGAVQPTNGESGIASDVSN
jgi:hypothetical protein